MKTINTLNENYIKDFILKNKEELTTIDELDVFINENFDTHSMYDDCLKTAIENESWSYDIHNEKGDTVFTVDVQYEILEELEDSSFTNYRINLKNVCILYI